MIRGVSMLKNTEQLVKKLFTEGLLSNVAIRVGVGDKVLGEVYRSNDSEITENTLFDMASVTKILSVTAVSLIALDSGKIGLHDKVSRYFDVPDHNRDLEIFHLLTHTTGVGHRNLTASENNYDNIAQKVLELCGNPIGANVEYSCPAFILLGKVLEKVYGKRLDVLFKEMVAEPLGMTRSGFLPDLDYPDGIVNSDVDPLLSATVNDYNCKYLGGVAGNAGVFSCISDVTRFVNMLLSNGKPLFSKNILDLASKNYTNGMSEARGLGFLFVDERYSQTGELFPQGSIGHCGHTGQSVFLNRESGLYVIILSDATVSTVKTFGRERYGKVMEMRRLIHNAIKQDLGL